MDFSQPGASGQQIQHGRSAEGNVSLMPALNHSDFVDVPLGSPSLSSVMANTEMAPRVSLGDEDKATTAVVLAPRSYSASGATTPLPPPVSALQTVAPLPSSESTAETWASPPFSMGAALSMAPLLSPVPGIATAQPVGTAFAYGAPVMTSPTPMADVQPTDSQLFSTMDGVNPTLAPSCHPSLGTCPTASTLARPGVGSVSQAAAIPPITEVVSGYEGMQAGNRDWRLIPPPADPTPAPEPVTLPDGTQWTFPPITENEAKKAFLKYIKRKGCYGSAPARQMTIRELRSFGLYRYRLETFTESRACKWLIKRYVGQAISFGADGHIPRPWDIPVQVAVLFKDGIRTITVPHSTYSKFCPKCNGMGEFPCQKCHGARRIPCMMCDATGRYMLREKCSNCNGKAVEHCRFCNDIKVSCVDCWGRGRIINSIQMTVSWKNNVFEFIENHNTDFPSELFKKASGEIIFKDEQVVVAPLLDAPVPSIRNASQDAQTQHRNLLLYCRVLRQRQCVEWLPLTKMEYSWEGNDFSCYIYGKDNLVHTVSYPVKCCCIIT